MTEPRPELGLEPGLVLSVTRGTKVWCRGHSWFPIWGVVSFASGEHVQCKDPCPLHPRCSYHWVEITGEGPRNPHALCCSGKQNLHLRCWSLSASGTSDLQESQRPDPCHPLHSPSFWKHYFEAVALVGKACRPHMAPVPPA